MSFWLKKILYSLRVLPILFTVIIGLISIRLLLVFTGIINTHEILPIGSALAAAKDDKATSPPQEKNNKNDKNIDSKQNAEQKSSASQQSNPDEKPNDDPSQ